MWLSTSLKKPGPESGEAAGERRIAIGRLVATHGVRGELRLHPFNAGSEAVERVAELFVFGERGPRPIALRGARPHRGGWIVSIEGVATMDEARSLVGAEVAVRERDLPRLEPGSYYHFQLVGLAVVDESGAILGEVKAVMSAGGNDVLVIEGADRERMVPMVDETIREVDLSARRIVVRPLEGLFDA